MELIVRLDDWFEERLRNLSCGPDTRAYVVGVMAKYRYAHDDMSKSSVVLSYVEAREEGSFEAFQRIGDWSLFVCSVYPAYVAAHAEVVKQIGSQSFATCHRMMMGKWPVYEELSVKLSSIAHEVGSLLIQK